MNDATRQRLNTLRLHLEGALPLSQTLRHEFASKLEPLEGLHDLQTALLKVEPLSREERDAWGMKLFDLIYPVEKP